MLIQFSVENYRVFETKQTFSMVADSNLYREDPTHVSETGFVAAPQVHHQASIFGPNGAGKTSLIRAIAFMRRFVKRSFVGEPSDLIETEHFAYSKKSQLQPSVFEIVFIDGDTLFEYGFAVTPELVQEEWLTSQRKGESESRCVFTRDYDKNEPDNYKWYFNSQFVDRDQDFWRNTTRPNALFLSTAVRFNQNFLIRIFNWITKNIVFLDSRSRIFRRRKTAQLCLDEDWKQKILKYFDRLDIELDDILVDEVKYYESSMFASLPDTLQKKYREERENKTTYEIFFVRKDEERIAISLPLKEEASGVIEMFDIAGQLLQSVENGFTIFVDEVSSSIHPLVIHELISIFNGSEHGHSSAQLIFTTHDVTVPESESIDKDQVWFINKESNFSSNLYSYSECEDTSDLPYHRKYLYGHFGAIPLIS